MKTLVFTLIISIFLATFSDADAQSRRKRHKRANLGLDEGKLENAEDAAFSGHYAKKIKNGNRETLKPNKGREVRRPDSLKGKNKRAAKKAKGNDKDKER